jgi:3-hydroxy-9,10-secoandrosta-1,3,5(10)-triene-9,17-dione monooxygenase
MAAPRTGFSIPVPEPDLTPAAMLARAEAMRSVLRERQPLAESQGRMPEATHEEFLRAGFYRVLQPRIFGGYEFDLTTFVRLIMEVARGCPESAWSLALIAGHPVLLAALPEEGQREAFGSDGECRVPAVALPGGVAVRCEDGYRVRGAWDYASGIDVATHFMGRVLLAEPRAAAADAGSNAPAAQANEQSAPPRAPIGSAYVLFHPGEYKIVDNWRVFGMQGTGSKRVVVGERVLPAHRLFQATDAAMEEVRQQPGRRLHENPLYHAPAVPILISELAAVAVGAARCAIDFYEDMLRTRKSMFPPFSPRYEVFESQQRFGHALGLTDTAEMALLQFSAEFTACARREKQENVPFTAEATRRLLRVEQQVVQLAWDAVELLFRTSGSSSAKPDSPLGRVFRNLAVIRTHVTVQLDQTSANVGRLHFGLPAGPL